MQINGLSETEYLQELYNKQKTQQSNDQVGQQGQFDQLMDQLIISCQQTGQDSALNSGTYNSQGFQMCDMEDGRPPLPPEPPVDMEGTDISESTESTDSTQDILDQISQTMRVNQDSIQSTLDELGLTVDDLSDSDNMTLLCDTLNEKAGEMGLPQIDDLEDSISSLLSQLESIQSAQTEAESETEAEEAEEV